MTCYVHSFSYPRLLPAVRNVYERDQLYVGSATGKKITDRNTDPWRRISVPPHIFRSARFLAHRRLKLCSSGQNHHLGSKKPMSVLAKKYECCLFGGGRCLLPFKKVGQTQQGLLLINWYKVTELCMSNTTSSATSPLNLGEPNGQHIWLHGGWVATMDMQQSLLR